MKASDRDQRLYLEDMVTAMARIAEYIESHNEATFVQDYKTLDAVIRNLEVIGEASKNISKSLKAKNPGIPWDEMYRLRNRITHEYFGVDYHIIWSIVYHELPKNHLQITALLESLDSTEPS